MRPLVLIRWLNLNAVIVAGNPKCIEVKCGLCKKIVLARQALVHYGRYIIPMDVFLGAGRYTRRHCYDCCYDHCAARANNKWSKIYSQLKKLSQIESMRQLRLAHKAGTKISLFNSMMGGIDSRKATNPRDSVFGVLGPVKERSEEQHVWTPVTV